MSEPILEARDVVFEYQDGTKALKGVSVSIKRGQRVAILGANGAGKSTLFLHFNGILRPKKGSIVFNGRVVKYDHRSIMELRKKVGIVFQNPDTQLFAASVMQEVSFGPMNLKLPQDEVSRRVEDALRFVGMYDIKDKPTHFLSYGQKKRVSIADVLAMDPDVIIFDEPTAYLDPVHIDRVIEMMNKLSNQGKAVIFSTHDIDMAYSLADYIYVMKDGAILGHGLPQDVFNDSELLINADIKRPLLLDVYRVLQKKGIVSQGLFPRNINELINALNNS